MTGAAMGRALRKARESARDGVAPSSSAPVVRERGVLFSAPMVRAILAGHKTQTRRVLSPQPPTVEAVLAETGAPFSVFTDRHAPLGEYRVAGSVLTVKRMMGMDEDGPPPTWRCPQGMAGDRLWVREAWRAPSWCDERPPRDIPVGTPIDYLAHTPGGAHNVGKYRHARFMPRWMSRLTLEVTEVRVQRLHDIREEEAIAEGVDAVSLRDMPRQGTLCRRDDFAQIWDLINGKGAWKANPWVFAISFRRCA